MIKLHFLNVGHGDCIIIEFMDNNRVAVIDINMTEEMESTSYSEYYEEAYNSLSALDKIYYQLHEFTHDEIFEKTSSSFQLTNPINYIKNLNSSSIFRFISTHPHMDHLSGVNELKNEIRIGNFWINKNSFSQNVGDLSESEKNDWTLYKKYRDTNEHELDGIGAIRPKEGDSNQYWNEDKITILSPNADLIELAKEKNNPNIMSYVLLIEYAGRKIILGGDAEEDTWTYINENYSELIKNVAILKASHHGRNNGYYQPVVEQMNPEFTIVSVGKKPKTDASNKYTTYCDNVWSTRWKGNITFEIDAFGNINSDTQYDR